MAYEKRKIKRCEVCGKAPVVVKNKKGRWGCFCLACDLAVFNYHSEADAIEAWNEEVAKK